MSVEQKCVLGMGGGGMLTTPRTYSSYKCVLWVGVFLIGYVLRVGAGAKWFVLMEGEQK